MRKVQSKKVVSHAKTCARPKSAEDHTTRSTDEVVAGSSSQSYAKKEIKTSTPNKLGTDVVDITMNMSCISSVPNASFLRPQSSASVRPSTAGELHPRRTIIGVPGSNVNTTTHTSNKQNKSSKPVPNVDDELLASFNALYQSEILKKVVHESGVRAKDEIDKQLAALQKRISDDQEIIEKTKQQIKQMQTYSNMKTVLNDYTSSLKNASDNVQKAADKNDLNNAVVKELEKMRNQLECEKIVLPASPTGSATLNEIIKETSTDNFQKFSEDDGNLNQMSMLLEEYQNMNKRIEEMNNLFVSGMSDMNSSVLADMSSKISENLRIVSNNNDSIE